MIPLDTTKFQLFEHQSVLDLIGKVCWGSIPYDSMLLKRDTIPFSEFRKITALSDLMKISDILSFEIVLARSQYIQKRDSNGSFLWDAVFMKNDGDRFQPEVQNLLSTIDIGDVVIFANIVSRNTSYPLSFALKIDLFR